MKIAVFFTYQYSISTLIDSGIFDREMKIYKKLNEKFNIDFIFFTYESHTENKFTHGGLQFIPLYNFVKFSNNKLLMFLKSLIIPLKIKNIVSDVDIFHQHQLLGSWVPLLLKALTKKPLITRTGYDAYDFSIKNNEGFLRIKFYKLLTKITLRYSNAYTVTSAADIKFLSSKFKVDGVKLVPNWVEVNHSKLKRYDDRILMVGRLEYQKNYQMALDFLDKSNVELGIDIYGTGSLKEDLQKTVLNSSLNIKFLGNINHEELISIYQQYTYFLSTSEFEGNPKTILEALANGCIVFAKYNENNAEIIHHGENGYLFSSLDELIDIFKKEYNQKESQLKNDKSHYLKNNNIDLICKKMYKDYKDLIEFK